MTWGGDTVNLSILFKLAHLKKKKKKTPKNCYKLTARYKNKITVYNAQPLHPMLSHLSQLLLIHLSWEVVNLFSLGRGYFSQSRARFMGQHSSCSNRAVCRFQPSSAVPNSFGPSMSSSDMSLLFLRSFLNIMRRQQAAKQVLRTRFQGVKDSLSRA